MCSDKYYFSEGSYPELTDFYNSQLRAFWKPDEIQFQTDIAQFSSKLEENQRNFLSYILAFFSFADGVVNENLIMRFYKDTPSSIKEARFFYGAQMFFETMHAKTYAMMLEKLVKDQGTLFKVRNAVESYECLKLKKEWMDKYMDKTIPFTQRVIAFCCIEGISFCAAFCGIFWFRKQGLLPGVCQANEFIARDESIHRNFGIALFKILTKPPSKAKVTGLIEEVLCCETSSELKGKLTGNLSKEFGLNRWKVSDLLDKYIVKGNVMTNDLVESLGKMIPVKQSKVHEIVKSCMELEEKFIHEALSNFPIPDLPIPDLINYTRLVADTLLRDLGYDTLYNVENPFSWMNLISLTAKTNFFERNVSEYKTPRGEKEFSMTEAF